MTISVQNNFCMQKTLFIHGLNSDKNSGTGQVVKTLLEKHGI
ncbi:hypothetical protein [Treponema denticola]|nr:hypothetical protein [Treponema denticola]